MHGPVHSVRTLCDRTPAAVCGNVFVAWHFDSTRCRVNFTGLPAHYAEEVANLRSCNLVRPLGWRRRCFAECASANGTLREGQDYPSRSASDLCEEPHRSLTTVRPYMFVEISPQLFRKGTGFLSDYTQIHILFVGALRTLVNQRRFQLCVHFRRVLPFQT